MKHAFSNRFIRQYQALSAARKAKFDKQLGYLFDCFQFQSHEFSRRIAKK